MSHWIVRVFWSIWIWCRKKSKILEWCFRAFVLMRASCYLFEGKPCFWNKILHWFKTFSKGLTVLMTFFSEKVSQEKGGYFNWNESLVDQILNQAEQRHGPKSPYLWKTLWPPGYALFLSVALEEKMQNVLFCTAQLVWYIFSFNLSFLRGRETLQPIFSFSFFWQPDTIFLEMKLRTRDTDFLLWRRRGVCVCVGFIMH